MDIIVLGETGIKDTAHTLFPAKFDPARDRSSDLLIGQIFS